LSFRFLPTGSPMPPDDLRSVSDKVLQTYLYSVAAWALCLLGLFVMDRIGLALSFCFPLSLWLGVLTLWWWVGATRRHRAGELTGAEVRAGVQTIGRILAGSGVIPGIIFLALRPLEPAAWGTCLGIGLTSFAAWHLVHLSSRLNGTRMAPIFLTCAWAILPANATGAVSLGTFLRWFEQVKQVTLP
jgi:hypothetical protein